MIRPLAIASDGYLCKTNTLSIAVNGYICINKEIIIPKKKVFDDGGSDSKSKKSSFRQSKMDWYKMDDEEIVLIIKTFLQCQN
jgi:hypothetical protein